MGEWPIIPKSFSYYKTTEAQAREVDEMPDKDEIDLIINLDHLPFPEREIYSSSSCVLNEKQNSRTRGKKKRRKKQKKTQEIKDDICGHIRQKCDGNAEEYWRSIDIDPLPSGSVTVLNSSGYKMTVKADLTGDGNADIVLFSLTERDQSKSVSLGSIAKIEVICEGDSSQICNGMYSVLIAYPKDVCK